MFRMALRQFDSHRLAPKALAATLHSGGPMHNAPRHSLPSLCGLNPHPSDDNVISYGGSRERLPMWRSGRGAQMGLNFFDFTVHAPDGVVGDFIDAGTRIAVHLSTRMSYRFCCYIQSCSGKHEAQGPGTPLVAEFLLHRRRAEWPLLSVTTTDVQPPSGDINWDEGCLFGALGVPTQGMRMEAEPFLCTSGGIGELRIELHPSCPPGSTAPHRLTRLHGVRIHLSTAATPATIQ